MGEIKHRRLTAIYIRPVPVDIKDKFKAYCARRGKFMRDAFIDFMRECIEADAKTNVPHKNRKPRK